MGDMANFALEQCEVNEELRDKFRQNNMSIHDAYENGIVNELGHEQSNIPTKTCRCCNTNGLTWGTYKGGWALFKDNILHDCPVNKLNR